MRRRLHHVPTRRRHDEQRTRQIRWLLHVRIVLRWALRPRLRNSALHRIRIWAEQPRFRIGFQLLWNIRAFRKMYHLPVRARHIWNHTRKRQFRQKAMLMITIYQIITISSNDHSSSTRITLKLSHKFCIYSRKLNFSLPTSNPELHTQINHCYIIMIKVSL